MYEKKRRNSKKKIVKRTKNNNRLYSCILNQMTIVTSPKRTPTTSIFLFVLFLFLFSFIMYAYFDMCLPYILTFCFKINGSISTDILKRMKMCTRNRIPQMDQFMGGKARNVIIFPFLDGF